MNNLRFIRRQVEEQVVSDAFGAPPTFKTVIKLILQERLMDGVTEVWEDVPVEDEST